MADLTDANVIPTSQDQRAIYPQLARLKGLREKYQDLLSEVEATRTAIFAAFDQAKLDKITRMETAMEKDQAQRLIVQDAEYKLGVESLAQLRDSGKDAIRKDIAAQKAQMIDKITKDAEQARKGLLCG